MCRIFAVQGTKPAMPFLTVGIGRLRYGGYDSIGQATLHDGAILVRKTQGTIEVLASMLEAEPLRGTTGVAHTRWATNGPPNTINAHPHVSWNGKVVLVHNGVLDSENEKRHRDRFKKRGIACVSDTDTEVIANVIAIELEDGANSLEHAVERGLSKLDGAYALAIMGADYPDQIIGVRRSSPLHVGLNGNEVFLASDPIAFAGLADRKVDLQDGEIVTLRDQTAHFSKGLADGRLEKYKVRPELVSKGGYSSFLLKEIMEQGNALRSVLAGRRRDSGLIRLGGIEKHLRRIADARRIVFTGCGTAYHAALLGKELIENLAHVPAEVQYAHEFRTSVIGPHDVVIAISQSGETTDTINAIKAAKETGALCLGINNRVGSTLSREVEAGIYLNAGPEISVASTKAFTAQVMVLILLALYIAQKRELHDRDHLVALAKSLGEVPDKITEALKVHDQTKGIAKIISYAKTVLYLGRGYGATLAAEGALKLQEVAYLNAQGRAGGELMHGFLALVEEGTPTIAIIGDDSHKAKMISSMQKVHARGGHLYVIRCGAVELPDGLAKKVIDLPAVPPEIMPIIAAVPLQLLAHDTGVVLGLPVDEPRNLAKSVTVES